MLKNTITNENGELRSVTVTGPAGIAALRLRTIIVALGLYAKTGMQPTRGVNIIKVAQFETGLKTRDHGKLIEALRALCDAQIAACTVTTDGVTDTVPEPFAHPSRPVNMRGAPAVDPSDI